MQAADESDRVGEDLDAVLVQMALELGVLPVSEPADRLQLGRVFGRAVRDGDAARLEEALDAVVARLAVHVAAIVVRLERTQILPGRLGARAEEVVEHPRPGRSMNRSGVGYDPVEVEHAGPDFLGYQSFSFIGLVR